MDTREERPIDASLYHRVLRPREETSGQPPALLMLHGRGSNEMDLIDLAGALDGRFLTLSPRAPFALGFGYHWYELSRVGVPDPQTFEQGLATLRRFVHEAVDGYGIDPAQLYVLGFSQGAVMTGALALTNPPLVAGAVMLSGYLPLHSGLPIDEPALAGRPYFVAHGTQDAVIPVTFGREARAYLERVAVDLTYHEYPMAHQVENAELQAIGAWLTEHLDRAAPSGNAREGVGP